MIVDAKPAFHEALASKALSPHCWAVYAASMVEAASNNYVDLKKVSK